MRAPLRLAPVRVSYDRIIRATVGLRPHRPSGFLLRAEKLDAKTLIHNFGHGGSGMSLSWGTGQMAAELALEQPDRRAAVLGCGVVGLTTARQLQRRGFTVTIYAAAVPPDTTSNMSLAGFTPTSGLVANDRRTAAWDAQFRRAVEIAYRQLQLLVGPKYGISWINQLRSDRQRAPRRWRRWWRSEFPAAGLDPHRHRSCSRDSSIRSPSSTPSSARRCESSRRFISTRSSATSSPTADASSFAASKRRAT